ncbi:MAG TPA: SDR family oxidoreductase [Acidimicrobiia bacterium]|nr:SDR family oxidoreductase [Acidimicrobiia bacterium]
MGLAVVGMARRTDLGADVAKEIDAAGGEFHFVRGDVSRPGDCDAAVAETLDRYGRLDVLVNNAGRQLDPLRRVEEMSDAEWRSIMDVALDGVFYMSRAALPTMQAQQDGAIVTISSFAGVQVVARTGAYGAAKAAVIQLMRTIAVENAGTGVRANAVLVGAVPTEMANSALLDMGRYVRGADWMPDLDAGPGALGAGMMEPEGLGRAVAVLCSDDSREITGAAIAVDRGFTSGSLLSHLLYLGAAQLLPT